MSGAQNSFWAQRYPEGIIQTLEEREIPLKAFLARGINQGNYDANRGIPGTGLIVSPYFTQTVEEEEVPVYGTLTYAESYDIGIAAGSNEYRNSVEKQRGYIFLQQLWRLHFIV